MRENDEEIESDQGSDHGLEDQNVDVDLQICTRAFAACIALKYSAPTVDRVRVS